MSVELQTVPERIRAGVAYVDYVQIYAYDRLLFRSAYDARPLLSQMPSAKWHAGLKGWHVPATIGSWEAAVAALSGYELFLDSAVRVMLERAERKAAAQAMKGEAALPPIPNLPASASGGWQHQRRAFWFARDLDAAGLFMDMGGGKTLVTIAIAEEMKSKTVVVLCPKSVIGVWPREFEKWGARDWDIFAPIGTIPVAKKAEGAWKVYVRPNGLPKLFVVNYDASWRNALSEFLRSIDIDLLVLDESHKIKSPSGKAAKYAAQLRKRARKCLMLTGTPMPHGPEDIYAQYRAADPNIFGTSYSRFKNQWMITRKITEKIDTVVGLNPLASDDFQRKLASISIIISREEMKLSVPGAAPPVLRECVLGSKGFGAYMNLKREFVAELESGEVVTADNALVKLMRLRQICSGYVKDDDGNLVELGTEKRDLFADVLEDLPRKQPIVVFAAFHHDLDNIREVSEKSGRSFAELSGRRRDALTEDSCLAPGVDVAGVQLQSGGVGVDFTRSSVGIYYSIDYNLGNVLQSLARLDRPGQQRLVTYVHLLARFPTGGRSVDGLTWEALESRQDMVEAILEASRNGKL